MVGEGGVALLAYPGCLGCWVAGGAHRSLDQLELPIRGTSFSSGKGTEGPTPLSNTGVRVMKLALRCWSAFDSRAGQPGCSCMNSRVLAGRRVCDESVSGFG